MPPQSGQEGPAVLDPQSLTNGTSSLPSKQRKEILYEGEVYDVTDWISRHPGGRIIEFYTQPGEDSTLAIQQFHNRSMLRVSSLMKSMKKTSKSNGNESTPPATLSSKLSPSTRKRHEALTKDFQALHKSLESEGFFKPSPLHLTYRLLELAALHCTGLYFLGTVGVPKLGYLLGLLSAAMFGGRCGWLMHEGGHHSLTGRPKLDRLLQSFIFGELFKPI